MRTCKHDTNLNEEDCMNCKNEAEESERLISELEKIYMRNGWRNVKQLVIYESEIKKRLSDLLAA